MERPPRLMVAPRTKVHLTAYGAKLVQPHGVCDHLPQQVHLQAGVNGDHIVVLGDHRRIVYIIDGVHLYGWIVGDISVQLSVPKAAPMTVRPR